MGFFSNLIGQGLGAVGGALFGNGEAGRKIGEGVGSFLPFHKGGRVKKPKEPKRHFQKKKHLKKK